PPGATPVYVESVHPLAPAGPTMYADWAADISRQPSAGPDGPVRVLLGDFNATLDHRTLRDVIDTGYRDAADAVGKGLVASWPSSGGFPGLVTIDHVLADERIGVRDVEVHSVTASDHRAVLASLTIPPAPNSTPGLLPAFTAKLRPQCPEPPSRARQPRCYSPVRR
ncbi:MAG: endonuclease/exonuclease/phosphatase family protein, partial [Actinoplanes sp.]